MKILIRTAGAARFLTRRSFRPPNARYRGVIILQGVVCMAILLMLCSLTVDIGIYYLAKAELQRCADAAALAAASVLEDGGASAATSEATRYATADNVISSKLPSSAVTSEIGRWTNNAFLPGGATLDSVRVTVRRCAGNGNALELPFSRLLGLPSVNVSATAISKIKPLPPNYNFVGIDSATFSSLGVLAEIKGRIVSNGDIKVGKPLGLLVGVDGDARSFGGSVQKGLLAWISNSTLPLPEALDYPSVSLPIHNDNAKIASCLNGSNDFTALVAANIPAGTYVVRDLNMIAGILVNLDGPVTFYVQRNFNFAANVNLLGGCSFSAENFRVRVLPGGHVNFLAPVLVPVNMDLYAPDTDITLAVPVTQYTGRLIARNLSILLPALGRFIEDKTLGNPLAGLPRLALLQ